MNVRVLAFGKINLYLDVLGKRPDGFHEVAMIMQSVRLADVVNVTEGAENQVTTNSRYVPDNEYNLALQAALLMQKNYPELPKVNIKIEKNIPVSAGMAGGSTDAAAVIVALNELGGLARPEAELMAIGAQLGSDVPFCIGGPTALAMGRGEHTLAVPTLPKWHLVLVKPNFGVSTAKVYGHYHRLGTNARKNGQPRFERYVEALLTRDGHFLYRHLFNALEPTTFSLYPKVKQIKEMIASQHNGYVLMSGSGPTIFSAFEDEEEAWHVFRKLRQKYANTLLTSTVDDETQGIRMYSSNGS